eukprot:m51a1_g313 hypothetical protein (214) ;mRNA; r:415345-415986
MASRSSRSTHYTEFLTTTCPSRSLPACLDRVEPSWDAVWEQGSRFVGTSVPRSVGEHPLHLAAWLWSRDEVCGKLTKAMLGGDPQAALMHRGLDDVCAALQALCETEPIATTYTTYRGLRGLSPEAVLHKVPDRSFSMGSFAATSRRLDVARDFVGGGGVVLRFLEVPCKGIARWSAFPDEDEYLISPKQKVVLEDSEVQNIGGVPCLNFVAA